MTTVEVICRVMELDSLIGGLIILTQSLFIDGYNKGFMKKIFDAPILRSYILE